ncbi:MAG TPA: hypothetical protein VMH24_06625, partial [Candidatus Sulfotelmatobacter sp.]|nr:hypothetical protein [Candidatus Sulfotelmatobacter sp.]
MSGPGGLDAAQRARLAAVADHLIPAAHGMPSAGEVIGDARLRFVMQARPDLEGPLHEALDPRWPAGPVKHLAALAA